MNDGPAKRVLLTGASGFLGTPCRRLLVERGFDVHAVSRGARSEADVTWHVADLLEGSDRARLIDEIRPSHLLHLAWASGHNGFRNGVANYRWVGATLELFRLFEGLFENGDGRIVAVGTGAEYDWSDGLCQENETPLRPSSTYGLCKRTTSELFARFLDQHDGVTGAWARLFFLYGPREDDYRLLPSVVKKIAKGEVATCTFDRLERDYLFIDDAARGLVDLLESDVQGPINIAAGEAISLGRLVGLAAEKLGRPELLELGGQPTGPHPSGSHPSRNRPSGDGPPPVVRAEITRAREELGWSPHYTLEEALDRTLDWWRRCETGLAMSEADA